MKENIGHSIEEFSNAERFGHDLKRAPFTPQPMAHRYGGFDSGHQKHLGSWAPSLDFQRQTDSVNLWHVYIRENESDIHGL